MEDEEEKQELISFALKKQKNFSLPTVASEPKVLYRKDYQADTREEPLNHFMDNDLQIFPMSNQKDEQNIQLKSMALIQEYVKQEITSIDEEVNYIKRTMTQLVNVINGLNHSGGIILEKDRKITKKKN